MSNKKSTEIGILPCRCFALFSWQKYYFRNRNISGEGLMLFFEFLDDMGKLREGSRKSFILLK